MVIRPMTAAYSLGDLGRPAAKGGRSGPTAFFGDGADTVALGRRNNVSAGLYGAGPLFKIMGAVELMSEEHAAEGEGAGFGGKPAIF